MFIFIKKHCVTKDMNKNSSNLELETKNVNEKIENLDLESKIRDIRGFFLKTVNSLGEAVSLEIENFRAELVHMKDEIRKKLAPSLDQASSTADAQPEIFAQPETFAQHTPQPQLTDTPAFKFPRYYAKNRTLAHSNPINLRNSFSPLHIEVAATWQPDIVNIPSEKTFAKNPQISAINSKPQTKHFSYPFINPHKMIGHNGH